MFQKISAVAAFVSGLNACVCKPFLFVSFILFILGSVQMIAVFLAAAVIIHDVSANFLAAEKTY